MSYDVGMLCCHVVLLARVFRKVVELHGSSVTVVVDDSFPVSLKYGSAASFFMELPIEIVMFLAVAPCLSPQGGRICRL